MNYIMEYQDVVTSTNQICFEYGVQGKENTILVANKQTAGRGRLGRDWHSEEGKGLYLSILHKATPEVERKETNCIPLVMALAAQEAIKETTGMECAIKWPNDLVYQGKKVAGILVQQQLKPRTNFFDKDSLDEVIAGAKEMSRMRGEDLPKVDFWVVGIGINLFHDSFPEELQDKATSLYLEKFSEIAGDDLKKSLIESIIRCWKKYFGEYLNAGSFFRLIHQYEALLISKDKEVIVHGPAGDFSGICKGITQEGHLMVSVDGQIEYISSGEVSVRGVNGYV